MELIRIEQNAKEEHVNEYLKFTTAPDTDKQQVQRIKAMFERKNMKSTQMLAHYQKKLDGYKRKVKETQSIVGSATASRELRVSFSLLQALRQGLKDVGANIKGGISGFSEGVVDNIRGAKDSIVSKPREFAHLIKNKYKFGSADNITAMKMEEEAQEERPTVEHKMPSEEEACSDVSGSALSAGNFSSPNPQSVSAFHQEQDAGTDLEPFFKELQNINEAIQRLSDNFDSHRASTQVEVSLIRQSIEEEHERGERNEEKLNELFELHHDLTELHQAEVTNIKQELSGIEEKMEYQLEERTRDMQDHLESCQTRITKMELQQQQQQLISMEGFENSNFRAFITKIINVVLAVLAVIFLVLSTFANFLSPFLTSRLRILSTLVMVVSSITVWQQWDALKEQSQEIVNHHPIFARWKS
ncbi:hypothetical protein CAPTEDRAFT_215864 [Capitella teleta]|uniref:Uncharacterized protein n=1 Tax=Capitella teleta TaxID=283909 RepID=R7U4M4_CAPTE|nr:hypothetical protein CAPTEDRAFT_215864 [Capitella teleta]|eukprot:ELU01315.1 hypothetical protein CAPTEDRAFT_215864 [Capitella teleta]